MTGGSANDSRVTFRALPGLFAIRLMPCGSCSDLMFRMLCGTHSPFKRRDLIVHGERWMSIGRCTGQSGLLVWTVE
jgi:hypothetical protein